MVEALGDLGGSTDGFTGKTSAPVSFVFNEDEVVKGTLISKRRPYSWPCSFLVEVAIIYLSLFTNTMIYSIL